MSRQISSLKRDNERLNQNVEYYQNVSNGQVDQNRVLRLTVDEFRQSNDILVQRIDSIRRELRISENRLQTAITANQVLQVSKTDTVTVVKTVDGFTFDKTIEFNPQTILDIYYEHYTDDARVDSIRAELEITNEPSLLVYSKREYKNKKNFFQRLFTLDWKKITTTNYTLVNSNELIENTDVRVLNIESK